jgi:hypothetical protein
MHKHTLFSISRSYLSLKVWVLKFWLELLQYRQSAGECENRFKSFWRNVQFARPHIHKEIKSRWNFFFCLSIFLSFKSNNIWSSIKKFSDLRGIVSNLVETINKNLESNFCQSWEKITRITIDVKEITSSHRFLISDRNFF